MKEGNNDIFSAGDYALGYLARPIYLFGAIHLVRADPMTDFLIKKVKNFQNH